MAASHISGPSIVVPVDNATESGPSVFYQGFAIPDMRAGYQPGITGAGRLRSVLVNAAIEVVNAQPAAAGAATIAAAQTATSGTALTLAATASAGIAPNTPMLPFGASSSSGVVRALALDPGFTTAATTAGSAVIVVATVAQFPRVQPGLNLAVAGGANATWILATVLSVSGTNVTLSTPMGATLAAAPIAVANGSGRNDETSTSVLPFMTAGAAALFDARSGVARGVSVTASGADSGWTATVRGYDVHGYPLTEAIAVTASGIAYGRKAFKYIASVTPTKGGGGSSTGTFSVGTSDLFGFAVRSDMWELLSVHWAGASVPSSTGYTAADVTTPATATTGDVRGTMAIGTINPGGAGATGGAADGTRRLVISVRLSMDNLVATKASNAAPTFGVAQYAG